MPTGTLMRNTIRQPVERMLASMRTPARIGAAIADRPMTGPKLPNTLPSSSGGKTSLSRPKPCGISSAPNPPWSARITMSASAEGATAHSADISVKPKEPIRKSRRRPKMSPRRAPVTSRTAKLSV